MDTPHADDSRTSEMYWTVLLCFTGGNLRRNGTTRQEDTLRAVEVLESVPYSFRGVLRARYALDGIYSSES